MNNQNDDYRFTQEMLNKLTDFVTFLPRPTPVSGHNNCCQQIIFLTWKNTSHLLTNLPASILWQGNGNWPSASASGGNRTTNLGVGHS
jgi:hypothetical protein